MKPINSIYVAGKMQDDGWREELFDERVKYDSQLRIMPGDKWPKYSDEQDACDGITVCGLRYTGPFFVDVLGGHGYSYSEGDEHGSNIDGKFYAFSITDHGADLIDKRKQVQSWCLEAIARADLIFAWIDCIDCYGTIAEIGYAKALGKIIWIACPREYRDLWFIYQMADYVTVIHRMSSFDYIKDALQGMLESYRQRHPQLDSPVEEAFWEAWCDRTQDNRHVLRLTPQYPIGRYRVDFANTDTHTAIELDGHATHSSPTAIAYDRKRQREIEEQGWHVIRFGGKEVFSNADACANEVWDKLVKRHQEQQN